MSSNKNSSPLSFKISTLSRAVYCTYSINVIPLQLYNKKSKKSPVAIGNKLHAQYNRKLCYISFNAKMVKQHISKNITVSGRGHPYIVKQIDGASIIGMYDNLYVQNGKSVLTELKTVTKEFTTYDMRVAVKQLQLYMWLLRDIIKETKFPLSHGIIDVVTQHDGNIIKKIHVPYDENVESWIKRIIKVSTSKHSKTPPLHKCKDCIFYIKNNCDMYKKRRKEEWVTNVSE